jgi:hypothetical protein
MVFAIVLTARKTTVQERIWPSVLRLWLDVQQKYIPQNEEFTDIKNTVISRCAPIPAAT